MVNRLRCDAIQCNGEKNHEASEVDIYHLDAIDTKPQVDIFGTSEVPPDSFGQTKNDIFLDKVFSVLFSFRFVSQESDCWSCNCGQAGMALGTVQPINSGVVIWTLLSDTLFTNLRNIEAISTLHEAVT